MNSKVCSITKLGKKGFISHTMHKNQEFQSQADQWYHFESILKDYGLIQQFFFLFQNHSLLTG